jgi:hypothetical protein
MTRREKDQNLMLVAAADGYAWRHGMPVGTTLDLFRQYGISQILRENYETLHTQSLDESALFAEDVLARMMR